MRSWILELFITLSIIQVCRGPWVYKPYNLGPPDNPKNPNLGCPGVYKKLTEDDNGPGPSNEDNEIRAVPTPPPHNHHHHHSHHHHGHTPHRGSVGLSCFGGWSSENEVEGNHHGSCGCGKKNKQKKSKSKNKKPKKPSQNSEEIPELGPLPFPVERRLFSR